MFLLSDYDAIKLHLRDVQWAAQMKRLTPQSAQRARRFKKILHTAKLSSKPNKTRTSKVGAISKAQKAQNIFFEKNLKFSKKKF